MGLVIFAQRDFLARRICSDACFPLSVLRPVPPCLPLCFSSFSSPSAWGFGIDILCSDFCSLLFIVFVLLFNGGDTWMHCAEL